MKVAPHLTKKPLELRGFPFRLYAVDYSTTSTMRRVRGSTRTGRSLTTVYR